MNQTVVCMETMLTGKIIYEHICTYSCNSNFLKKAMDLKGSRGLYGSIWRDEREGENDMIIMLKIKI